MIIRVRPHSVAMRLALSVEASAVLDHVALPSVESGLRAVRDGVGLDARLDVPPVHQVKLLVQHHPWVCVVCEPVRDHRDNLDADKHNDHNTSNSAIRVGYFIVIDPEQHVQVTGNRICQ
ncbi:unnamed protein product [Phytophthora lilii]|uniref:Unnamed protein product n=1 Tax=Phytophthora lilii TaxID=2077276 RepID=A0A9W7CML7_9STRA|nr:unnamed protein product [Phytophthora lilii]